MLLKDDIVIIVLLFLKRFCCYHINNPGKFLLTALWPDRCWLFDIGVGLGRKKKKQTKSGKIKNLNSTVFFFLIKKKIHSIVMTSNDSYH